MRSIKTKIILSLLSVVIVVLGIYEIGSYIETKNRLYFELNAKADRLITRLTQGLELPLWEMDEAWQLKVISIEMMDKNVHGIVITDEQQKTRGKIRNAKAEIVDMTGNIEGNFILRHNEIFHDNGKIGTIDTYISTEIIEKQILTEAKNRLITLILIGFFMILSLLLISKKLLIAPLHDILDTVEAITKGDYSKNLSCRVCLKKDEIGLLALGIVEMSRAIQEREHEIIESEKNYRQLSEHLEERVIHRTEELERNNQYLQKLSLELIKTKDKAEAASRSKSIFLANMSHELRTPMNAVLGFSQLMQKDSSLSAMQRENLNIINNSGKHLLSLINDVLDMAKIEAGRVVVENGNVDLSALVRDTIDMMHERAEIKGLTLSLDQSSSFPRFILSDESKLRQILLNLISNAVKYTRKGEVQIRLNAEPLPDVNQCVLVFIIEDTGIGISKEDLPRIFDTFVQVSSESEQKGTGLGLPITKEYITLMNGSIDVISEVDKGSTFTFKLPVVKISPLDVDIQPHSHHQQIIGLSAGQQHYRVLIVEDQLENRVLLTRLLESVGFEVFNAVNGQDGVEQFMNIQPDFIWMDRRMPIMDGIEATRQIRALPKGDKVKIVAVTASVFLEQRQEFLAVGVDDIVNKPYRDEEIFDTMAKYLGVKFDYEIPAETVVLEKEVIDFETLKNIPIELNNELLEAAKELDIERCLSAIEEIEKCDSTLAKHLSERVNQFDFDTLSQWLSNV